MRALLAGADDRRIRLLDGLAAFWCALWLVVGAWTGYEIWQLSHLGRTVAQSGRALDDAGDALQSLGRVPVVGDRTAQLGGEVRATAGRIVTSALDTAGVVRRLSVLLGFAVVVIPVSPVLVGYLPARLARRSDRSDVVRAVRDGDPGDVDAFLAGRAVANLPYAALLGITGTPYADLREGRHRALADAELHRLGLRRDAAAAG